MRFDLLHYYERELRFLREQVRTFAGRHPALAGQLTPNPDRFEDPHVERLIEACSMLAARVQLRLDDEYSEFTSALLATVFPSYLRTMPAATIIQISGDPDRSDATTGQHVPRHTMLQHRQNRHVRFRTTYPVTLWPIEITGLDLISLREEVTFAQRRARAALRIQLRSLSGQSLADLELETLRFFLDGESRSTHGLYELLLAEPLGFLVGPSGLGARADIVRSGRYVPADGLYPVGFHRDEGLYEDTSASCSPLRILQEYFSFQEKFMFVDFSGMRRSHFADCSDSAEILVLLERLPTALTLPLGPGHMKLGCTPAVNLFNHYITPILLSHRVTEYPVKPDLPAAAECEVHSLIDVHYNDPVTGVETPLPPLYSLAGTTAPGPSAAFWASPRRPMGESDGGAGNMQITVVDRSGATLHEPPCRSLHVLTLCCNGDLPRRLPAGGATGDFLVEGHPGIRKVTRLREPSARLLPPDHRERHWRLVALLKLNLVSLIQQSAGDAGSVADGRPQRAKALQELLELLDFTNSESNRMRRQGLVGVEVQQIMRRITISLSAHATPELLGDARKKGELRRFLCRGMGITVLLDSSCYEGSSAFLFSAVLERFFALMAPVNSFTETAAFLQQREGVLKRWPPRSGERPLI